MRTRTLIPAVCLGLFFMAVASRSATYYVSTNGSDTTGNGISWATAVRTISNGVAKAGNGDTVLVSNGAYTLSTHISIAKPLTLQGFAGRDATVIDGNRAARGIYINNCTGVVVDGFTINNGAPNAAQVWPTSGGGILFHTATGSVVNCLVSSNISPTYGGGISVYVGAAQITNCIISANTATNWGGGAYINANTLLHDCTINGNVALNNGQGGGGLLLYYGGEAYNCLLHDNRATNGGGVFLDHGGFLRNSTIISNRAYDGGGTFASYGGIVSNSTIAHNTAYRFAGGSELISSGNGLLIDCLVISNTSLAGSGYNRGGGGVLIYDTNNMVVGCRILNNQAADGGGVSCCENGHVRNCLIANNAASIGGGVFAYTYAGISNRMESCTIASNRAVNGGGLSVRGPNSYFTNCIIASNSADHYQDIYLITASVSNNFSYCCSSFSLPPSQGNLTNEPGFADAPGGNYQLADKSPCINAGANLSWMQGALDLDGHRRIDSFIRRADMGCYEYMPRGAMFKSR